MKRIVIALGGNALGNNPEEQLKLVKIAAKNIVDLASQGYEVVVTHGNGPQVGMINLAMENSHEEANTPDIPFAECGAMSQGYIGYHLQQCITDELSDRNIDLDCVTVITQVLVDKNDPAFKNPTKPIGSFYTKEEALVLEKEKGYVMVEDAGRGYRRVVASPNPIKIIELDSIMDLCSDGNIVIACGGGGIPVIKTEKEGYEGIAAVIDKDKTAAKLAIDLKADLLLILTSISKVAINFNKENEQKLDEMTISEAKRYIEEGHFAKGSMLPKIEASLIFAETTNNPVIIAALEEASAAIRGKAGTKIRAND